MLWPIDEGDDDPESDLAVDGENDARCDETRSTPKPEPPKKPRKRKS